MIRVSLWFLGWFVGWLVVWVYGLCVLVCFSAFAVPFRALLLVLDTFLVCFLAFQRLWDASVTPGAPLCQVAP